MAYAMKRRRNGGKDPERREAGVKTRKSKMFARGQRLAAKLVAGRKMRGTRKDIYDEIKRLVRQHGSQSDVDLLTGPAGVGTPSNDFREGLNSVATDLSGFKPSRSSGRRASRAASSVTRAYSQDRKDTKEEFDSQAGAAASKAAEYRRGGMSQKAAMKKAWREVKGESSPKRKSKSSGRRKKSSSRRSRARRNPSRDFGAEFLFI